MGSTKGQTTTPTLVANIDNEGVDESMFLDIPYKGGKGFHDLE